MRPHAETCGCFPTGRHYPGIAHLLRASTAGLVTGIPADAAWQDLEIALLDVETTGRDASIGRVIEAGLTVGRGGKIVAKYNWLVNPGIPIPAESSAVHGLHDEDVQGKPSFAEIAGELGAAFHGRVPAAYNAPFDKAFLMAELARANVDTSGTPALDRAVAWIDPLVWAREIQQAEKSRALGDVAARLGIEIAKAHRATEDAEAALRVFYVLGQDGRVPRAYGALVQEQRRLALAQADGRRAWQKPR